MATLQPKDCIFRIYRDTRFSPDKTPYKTHVSAAFSESNKKLAVSADYFGYYLQIEFGSLLMGGGAYALDTAALQKVRRAIVRDPDTFRALLAQPDFMARFGGIKGERNKVMPAEFKEAARTEPLLTLKQFYFMTEMDPEVIAQPDFPEFVAAYFRAGQQVNNWLREVLR